MIEKAFKFFFLLSLPLFLWAINAGAQSTGQDNQNISYDGQGRPIRNSNTSGGRKDSLQHRDRFADSITIYYHYYDSTRNRTLDSSINDFTKRFPQPYWYTNLGNYGTAARSYIFSPIMKPGWDAGFHQFDIYNFKMEDSRFFTTTRPFTQLGYLLGNKAEQLVDILHTQNRKESFNFSFEYRFTNSPGVFQTQNASINSMRVTAHYKSDNKRYEYFLIYMTNKNAASENGGITSTSKLNPDSLALNSPFEVPTRLGANSLIQTNPFNTSVYTGNTYKQTTINFRHQYDFGQKDSLVTDSVTYKLFYARFRIQHTLTYNSSSYMFQDTSPDSVNYKQYFNLNIPSSADTITYKDSWSNITNELSLVSFPEKNNQSQYLKAGVAIQNLKGTLIDSTVHSFYNIYALGEYRNRTRNQKWDIEANGQLYLAGMNAGDYAALISLKTLLSKSAGYLGLGFQNTNRTASFIFNPLTDFPVSNKQNFNKENITRIFADYENPRQHFKLSGEYFLVSNYTYFDSFFVAAQDARLFNFLHVSAEKVFKITRHWNWYTEVHLQQVAGNAPVHEPFLLTRNRFAFEGNFFTNLFLSTGLELKYYTNYKADNYSPFNGQFFYQNSFTTANRPDINLFFDFRIKTFNAFLRLENLNSLGNITSFQFNHYNYATNLYPSQTLWIRFGIWWNFIN